MLNQRRTNLNQKESEELRNSCPTALITEPFVVRRTRVTPKTTEEPSEYRRTKPSRVNTTVPLEHSRTALKWPDLPANTEVQRVKIRTKGRDSKM